MRYIYQLILILLINTPTLIAEDYQAKTMIVKGFGGLGLCLAVFCVGIYILKRFEGRTGCKGEIKMISRLQITNKHSVAVIQIRENEYVCTIAGDSLQLIPLTADQNQPKHLSIIKKSLSEQGI